MVVLLVLLFQVMTGEVPVSVELEASDTMWLKRLKYGFRQISSLSSPKVKPFSSAEWPVRGTAERGCRSRA